MLEGSGNRILPVLAAVLVSVSLALLVVLLVIREPEDRRFDAYLRDAEFALQNGNVREVRRTVLVASRDAISARNWQDLLSVAFRALPDNPAPGDYKLFSTVSGRAAAAIPGEERFRAWWSWALMRQGSLDRAKDAADTLENSQWHPLVAEITLKSAIGSEPEDLDGFISRINPEDDPEFLESAAALSSSAELAFDAALLYMRSGRTDRAYALVDEVMSGSRFRWSRPDMADRQGVALASSSMAQDYGDRQSAIAWLEGRMERDRERRAVGWEELQMLGDLYWESFLLQGREIYRSKASDSWREAMDIVRDASAAGLAPPSSWRLWVNQAVLEDSRGRVRESNRLLDEALILYPGSHEVKASWALEMENEEPALARRLARDAWQESGNPVLGITAMRLDPEYVSPRLYEARLWNLFESATLPDSGLQGADSRIIAVFLLEYMTSRKNYSSIDVAVDRYIKAHEDSDWILAWRLAADAARNWGTINLVPAAEGGMSLYEKMRDDVRSEGSWRGLHDSAMFAVMVARELDDAAERYAGPYSEGGGGDPVSLDAAIMADLEPLMNRASIKEEPIGDRLKLLFDSRADTGGERQRLSGSGRRGIAARADMAQALRSGSRRLREEALESLMQAESMSAELPAGDRASLLYLEALILAELGRLDESMRKASLAVEADPQHARARELLSMEAVSE